MYFELSLACWVIEGFPGWKLPLVLVLRQRAICLLLFPYDLRDHGPHDSNIAIEGPTHYPEKGHL